MSILISLKFVSNDSFDKKVIIDLDNGFAPNKRKAISWTNYD